MSLCRMAACAVRGDTPLALIKVPKVGPQRVHVERPPSLVPLWDARVLEVPVEDLDELGLLAYNLIRTVMAQAATPQLPPAPNVLDR